MADDHHHPVPRTAVEERVDALEALLIEKGILDPTAIDAIVAYYEHDVGPMNGARVVARAWCGARSSTSSWRTREVRHQRSKGL